jgi:prepilin-type N-terminal cleavage/methylation domain-containing protein
MLRREDGFTLPELLVTLAIAMIVSLATFALVEVVMRRSGEVGARVETTQRARTAMDQITRQLRSQVCAWRNDVNPAWANARSIESATPTSVVFFTDLSDETGTAGAERHELTVEDDAIVEKVTAGQRGNPDTAKVTYSYGGATTITRPVLTDVTLLENPAAPGTTALFRYFKFNAANPPQPATEIAPGRALTAAEVQQIAKIAVTYRVRPQNGSATGATTLQNEVYVRTADPNAPTPKPTCLTT